MTLKVHHLRPAPGAHTPKTRVGRGEGSKGKTAGRGTKGTGARGNISARLRGRADAAAHAAAQALGLQEQQQGRVPGRQPRPDRRAVPAGRRDRPGQLAEAGAVRRGQPVKVLGTGDLGGVKVDVHGARVLRVRRREDRRGRGQHHRHLTETVTPRARSGRSCRVAAASLRAAVVRAGRSLTLTRPTQGRARAAGVRRGVPDARPPAQAAVLPGDDRRLPAGRLRARAGRLGRRRSTAASTRRRPPTSATSTRWSTCSPAARCCGCRSSRSGSCRTSRRASSCSCWWS